MAIGMAIAMAAPAIISGIMTFLNNREANKLAGEERRKLEQLVEQLKAPEFDPAQLDPAVFQVLENYVPEVASFLAEVAPTMMTGESAQAQEGLQIERDYLRQMMEQSQTGEDAELAIARNQARRDMAQNQQSGRATADAQMARRGFTPAGPMAYALSAQANSDAMASNALAGERGVADAADRRRTAMGEAGDLGRRFTDRGDDMESKNAEIMNAFNERVASLGNQHRQYAANTRNQAGMFNIKARQGAADKTAQSAYDTSKFNMGRKDGIVQAKADFDMKKLAGRAGITNMAREDIQNNAATKNAAWTAAGDAATKGIGTYQKAKKLRASENEDPDPVDPVVGDDDEFDLPRPRRPGVR